MKISPNTAWRRIARHRGIALIITLLMLSVVTITAVAFLAVSRRERASVASFAEQIDARYISEAGLNHAQARLSSRIAVANNRLAYGGYMVSTNYLNPLFRRGQSFLDRRNFRDLTNVAYFLNNGTPIFNLSTDLGRQDYARMLGNLYYDPRPPVFVQTNRNQLVAPQNQWDFRFYLDLNRNGQFETNGLQWVLDQNGRQVGTEQQWIWGDPEWIGVLQNPDFPHSGTNHFVGRFAYVVVPAAQALDLNFIGNDAKRLHLGEALPPPPIRRDSRVVLESGYLRNQGFGSWEINPAAFFAALNDRIWQSQPEDYSYNTNINQSSTGIAFSDAERLRRFRQQSLLPNSADRFFAQESGRPDFTQITDLFRRDFVDGYSDGPLSLTVADLRGRLVDNDRADRAWSGVDLTNHFVELNDLFRPSLDIADRITGQYTNSSGIPQTSSRSTYDRTTFYRMISQLGTDSADGRFESGVHPAYSDSAEAIRANRRAVNPYGFYRRPKLNLNYGPDDPTVGVDAGPASLQISTFRQWEAAEWFTNAAHRLLLSEEGITNALPFRPPGLVDYAPGLAVHGPVVVNLGRTSYRTNYSYNAQIHRPLQVAANIYDGANNRFIGTGVDRIAIPSVFRPVFYEDSRSPGTLRLHSYQEILGGTPEFLTSRQWVTADQATNLLTPSSPDENRTSRSDFNVFGIPWVVGAKKGLPNFNQAYWQTVIVPTRRLRVIRPSVTARIGPNELPFGNANGGGFRTEFQYLITFTNLVGVEAWNSYAKAFNRPVRIFATNVMEFSLRDETASADSVRLIERRESLSTSQIVAAPWNGDRFIAPGFNRNTDLGQSLQFPTDINMGATNVPGGFAVAASFVYDVQNRRALSVASTNAGWINVPPGNLEYLTPVLSAYVTNKLVFAITDVGSGRLLDFVTLQSVMVRTNILSVLSQGSLNDVALGLVEGGGGGGVTMSQFWRTNLLANSRSVGINNQMLASLGRLETGLDLWRSPLNGQYTEALKQAQIQGLLFFLGLTNAPSAEAARRLGASLVAQVPFNPSPPIYMSDRRMANDPLVHYTMEDLAPGYLLSTLTGYAEVQGDSGGVTPAVLLRVDPPDASAFNFDLGRRPKRVSAYAPWGVNANLIGAPPNSNSAGGSAFDYAYKDPQIRSSDDWNFPVATNAQFRFPGIGQLGRIHRGTPWQTLYLKSKVAAETNASPSFQRFGNSPPRWSGWAGNSSTAPTNDWKYLNLFTTAYNQNAARGQMGVNQTNLAAWSAVLSGVPLFRNGPGGADDIQPFFLTPDSDELRSIVEGRFLGTFGGVRFFDSGVQTLFAGRVTNAVTRVVSSYGPHVVSPLPSVGAILQVPVLSDRAPFFTNNINWSKTLQMSDEVLERLPQQVLSLLRSDEPRLVIYSYGQTLKPAANAISLRPGPLYGMSTNYSITGEYVTKTVLRLDGDPRLLQPIIEDQRVVLSNP